MRRVSLIPIVAALSIAGACRVDESLAQETSLARATLADGKSPAFAADADSILRELEAWRGLAFRRDLLVELVPADEVEDDKLNGWYESATERLVVVEGNTDRMGRGTLLHEMYHALQDQHFDLGRLQTEVEGMGIDAQRALRALIEGEAMLAVSEIMDYDFERHAHLPESGPIDSDRFEKIFHYGAGLRFVRALRDAGGWELVSEAYRNPPRTTAEILHPERYLDPERAREEPAVRPTVEIEGVDEALRRDLAEVATSRGEFALHLFLAGPEELRPRAAEIASHMKGDLAWPADDRMMWHIEFDDAAFGQEVLDAAELLGATVTAVGPTARVLMVSLPR